MSDIKLFRLAKDRAAELQGEASDLEKPLQTSIENNLEPLLGIRFLATEYSTENHTLAVLTPSVWMKTIAQSFLSTSVR